MKESIYFFGIDVYLPGMFFFPLSAVFCACNWRLQLSDPKRPRSLHLSKTGLPPVLRVRSKVPRSAEG